MTLEATYSALRFSLFLMKDSDFRHKRKRTTWESNIIICVYRGIKNSIQEVLFLFGNLTKGNQKGMLPKPEVIHLIDETGNIYD